jgi:hypothetical protein
MLRYVVYISRVKHERVVVEAWSELDALDVARRVCDSREPGLVYLKADARPTDDYDRLSTYTCAHCRHQNAKEAWGPGRITCPECGQRAPRASELEISQDLPPS